MMRILVRSSSRTVFSAPGNLPSQSLAVTSYVSTMRLRVMTCRRGDPRTPVVGALAFTSTSQHIQTFATTHSAELLDSQPISFKYVLGVASHGGETRIGPLDHACVAALRDGRFTVGELLRMGQTQPDPD